MNTTQKEDIEEPKKEQEESKDYQEEDSDPAVVVSAVEVVQAEVKQEFPEGEEQEDKLAEERRVAEEAE